MEPVRARCVLAVGAVALAMTAAAGAASIPPRDLTADLALVAARVPASPAADPVVSSEGHPTPTPPPSGEPGVDGDPHGGMADPGHGAAPSPEASPGPMDMGGHAADPSPSAAPGHGHGAAPSAAPSAAPRADPSREPATVGHDEAPADGHDDGAGGHGEEEATEERPRAVVLGGFVALNGIALAGAAVLRRRDRAAATLKAGRTSTTQPKKDASR